MTQKRPVDSPGCFSDLDIGQQAERISGRAFEQVFWRITATTDGIACCSFLNRLVAGDATWTGFRLLFTPYLAAQLRTCGLGSGRCEAVSQMHFAKDSSYRPHPPNPLTPVHAGRPRVTIAGYTFYRGLELAFSQKENPP